MSISSTQPQRHRYKRWSDRRIVTYIPYGWLLLFFLIPFLLVFKISLSEPVLAIPPFENLIQWIDTHHLSIRINLNNFLGMIIDPFYAQGFAASIYIASLSTAFCLCIGYVIAYNMTQAPKHWQPILVLLVVLPFCTSFLVRVYAWMGILNKDGLLNDLLLYLNLIDIPQSFLYNNTAVVIGIAYCYLPFMILPIYSVLDKIDVSYLEAASDLGCKPWRVFWRITFPLSLPGVYSGCILVFVPALGEYVIPELLGAPDNLMIGRIIWLEFFNNRDWPIASAVAVAMLILFIVPIMILQRHQLRKQDLS